MQFKIFEKRPLGVIALAAALAAVGFVGLRAAEHEANPPANVKMMPSSYAGSHHGYSAVIKQVVPAVVNISSSKMVKQQVGQDMIPEDLFRQFFGGQGSGGDGQQFEGRQFNVPHAEPREQKETGTGSGVIVSSEGYILTNNHVVDGATDVTVTLHDKREFKAKVIGTDPRTDIAVIKIDGSNFPTLTLADSDKVDVGDVVLAIGDPFGVGQTVTQGIVSATGRSLGGQIEQIENFIQTDAAINPGNSGGALVDDEGHLIGINTAIVGSSGGNVGIGFAVPIDMAKHDMDSILAHGKVDRGYLGVQIEDVTPDLAKVFHTTSHGALIGDVTAGSPADSAGLKRGDIVTELNGAVVPDRDQLRTRIGTMDPGTKVNLKVLRDGRTMDFALTLASFPEDKEQHAANVGPSEQEKSGLDGVSVQPLTPEIARSLKVAPQTHGVAISSVAESSRAFEAGLQEGDVIMEVNRQPVSTPGEFNRAVSATAKDQPVLLLVSRAGATTFIAIS
jgi:serine protease Do